MSRPNPTIGETSDHAPWTECVWATGVNIANAASGQAFPATPAEREALRVSGGGSDTAGASMAQLNAGWLARYHHQGDEHSGSASTITSLLGRGYWLAANGLYGSLPYHFRRWQPGGTFSHCCAARQYDATSGWWIDPLAPDGYPGELIPIADLLAFMASVNYDCLAVLDDSWRTTVVLPITDQTPALVDLATGAQLYDTCGKPLVLLTSGGAGVHSPFLSGARRAVVILSSGSLQLMLVDEVHVSNVRPVGSSTGAAYNAGIDAAAKAVASVPREAA